MQVNFTTKIGPFALADGPISFRDLFHIPFYVRKAFKIKGLKELRKIKWFIRNLKRRNFHSTSTEDGTGIPNINKPIIVEHLLKMQDKELRV